MLNDKRLSDIVPIKEAMCSLNWKRIKKHAKIIRNIRTLELADNLYNGIKANVVVALLSGVKPHEYESLLRSAFKPKNQKAKVAAKVSKAALLFLGVWSSFAPKTIPETVTELARQIAEKF